MVMENKIYHQICVIVDIILLNKINQIPHSHTPMFHRLITNLVIVKIHDINNKGIYLIYIQPAYKKLKPIS